MLSSNQNLKKKKNPQVYPKKKKKKLYRYILQFI